MNEIADKRKKLKGSAISIAKYIEPATILTLVVGAVYYIGWSYIDGFCQRVGLHHESLDFSTTYYVKQGFVAILISSIVVSLMLASGWGQPSSRLDALLKNSPALLAIAILLLIVNLGSTSKSRAAFNLMGATLGTIISLVAFFSWWKKPLVLWPKNIALKISIAILVYHHLVLAANALGDFRGRQVIEGETYDTSIIVFNWKEQPVADLEGKELVLIMHKDEKYYVVQRQQPAPQFPKVYIVPDEQVKYASINGRK